MTLEKEVSRAIRHLSATDTQTTMSDEAISSMITQVMEDARTKDYHFENAEVIILKQGAKKRLIKRYKDRYSSESILCQSIKQVLDSEFRVKYPNRNKISRALFGTLPAVVQMADFTIVKYDFKDYFNSISAEYAYNKIIKNHISDRAIRELICDFCRETEYTFAGLPTSNSIAEIVASEFDAILKQAFDPYGIVLFSRYIDDSVLILNRHVNEVDIRKMLNDSLVAVFKDKRIETANQCKTKFNQNKFTYISKRTLSPSQCSFDFLGYEFWLKKTANDKVEVQYGITQDKQAKYRKRLDHFIKLYTDPNSEDYNNTELLRHRVIAFSCREVHLSEKNRSNNWKVKGFISNYGELRFLLGTDLIHPTTEDYLKGMIKEAFVRAGVIPYYITDSDNIESGYNLFHNLKENKTLLFVNGIGYDYISLVKRCGQIGISNVDANGEKRSYSSLVRDYLIKVKVGY